MQKVVVCLLCRKNYASFDTRTKISDWKEVIKSNPLSTYSQFLSAYQNKILHFDVFLAGVLAYFFVLAALLLVSTWHIFAELNVVSIIMLTFNGSLFLLFEKNFPKSLLANLPEARLARNNIWYLGIFAGYSSKINFDFKLAMKIWNS